MGGGCQKFVRFAPLHIFKWNSPNSIVPSEDVLHALPMTTTHSQIHSPNTVERVLVDPLYQIWNTMVVKVDFYSREKHYAGA